MPFITGSGGGASPGEGGVYLLEATAAPAGITTACVWTFLYGTPQLTLTDPRHPIPTTPGVYAYTAGFFGPAVYTAGTKVAFSCEMDVENNDAASNVYGVLGTTVGGNELSFWTGLSFYCPAGNTLLAAVTHNDATSGTLDFTGKALIQPV